jgi:hypothetical protein
MHERPIKAMCEAMERQIIVDEEKIYAMHEYTTANNDNQK